MRGRERLIAAFVSVGAWASAALADTVDDLIRQLGDEQYRRRQEAQAELLRLLPGMSGTQLGKLRTATGDTDKEIARRSERILSQWSTSFQPVRDLLGRVHSRVVDNTTDDDLPGIVFYTVEFDSMRGHYNSTNVVEPPLYGDLTRKVQAVEQEARGANLRGLRQRLVELETYIDNQPAADWQRIFGAGAKENMLRKVQEAIVDALIVERDLRQSSDNVDPPPVAHTAVAAPGPQDVGRTLRLSLSQVIAAGSVGTFLPDYDAADGPPPEGYQFAGEVWRLFAFDGLVVGGVVEVGIEFGEDQLFGNRVIDPLLLRMARVSNGRIEILPDYTLDMANHVLTGRYLADSGVRPGDQFGLFALVQVPAPSTAAGLAAAGLWAWRRRGGGARSGDGREGVASPR